MSFQCISVAEAQHILQSEAASILDIRDPHSFMTGHIADAIHLTNENVDEVVNSLDKEKPVIVFRLISRAYQLRRKAV